MTFSLGEIAAMLGAGTNTPNRPVTNYSIDSRTAEPGALFFAIQGPRFDGHDFVAQMLEHGASGAVVSRGFVAQVPPSLTGSLIPVDDPERALQSLARDIRRRWGGPVVAVTGSTGKTTTKELIAAVLARRFGIEKLLKSRGNLNNHLGVPLSLLTLEPQHQVAVLELAMSAPGEIAFLASIAEPDTGVVTNVAPVHLKFFESIEGIARAKRELIQNLKPPRMAILNHDDDRVRAFAEDFEGRVLTYGFGKGADFHAVAWNPLPADSNGSNPGIKLQVKSPDYLAEFEVPLPGQHNGENALAAIATAAAFHVPLETVQLALREFTGLHQRSEVLRLASGVTVINDSYNSNPRAMARMLQTLGAWPRGGRRIAVAGEMLELGPDSPAFHREIGGDCALVGVDWIVAVQGDARFFVEGAIAKGLPAVRARFFEDAETAGKFCLNTLEAGDVVLIKGSREVHLERVVEMLGAAAPEGNDRQACSTTFI